MRQKHRSVPRSDPKIYVAGHRGMVGRAVVRELRLNGYDNLVTPTRLELDLTRQQDVESFLKRERPDWIVIAAAKVGGIWANKNFPGDFIYQNLAIQSNLIHGAYLASVKRLMFLGSTCIYPRMSPQPIKETDLLSGRLEQTNEAYAIAKIAGLKMCEFYAHQYGVDFRCLMPTNLYGFGDNYHATESHVIPGLIARFHEAKEKMEKFISVWGDGSALRDFLFVDDLAKAVLQALEVDRARFTEACGKDGIHINVGSGSEVSIASLSHLVKDVVSYNGSVLFDNTKPSGTPRKIVDITKIQSLGWQPETPLAVGLTKAYQDYKNRFVIP